MHISNFRPVKRVTDVVRVFHRVVQEMDGVRLVMVGEGPERMSAVGVAKQLNVLDKITFIGSLDNVEDLLPCAHVLLQPSEHESFGLVSLEAMSCEVPVVATRSGGITEVVEHGVCGFLCDVGNIEEMAGNVLRLLKDESLRQAMGRNGRRRAIEKFHVENIVTQYEQLYYDILSRP
jgi:N-acetyl-alpha-D-glucosaminyl L-malate synthase BshA